MSNSRLIKFRAWDEEAEYMYYSDKCWENDEAKFLCESDGTLKCYVPETIEATRDEPEHIVGREIGSIMQFTGFKDRNKTDIYGGDIAKLSYGIPPTYDIVIIEYADEEYIGDIPISCWWMRNVRPNGCSASLCKTYENDLEIIGNIIQDKELLNDS